VNLKQLSEHLGLSQTTVSRALNRYPEVSEETRRRVIDAASAFDYRPNASARRLALGHTGTIGLTYPLGRGMPIDAHFAEFLAGLAETIAESDSDLLIIPMRGTGTPSPKPSHLRSVDAVIISAPGLNDPLVPMLEKLKLPFVLHGRTNAPRPYAYLDIDNEGGFRRATELLLDLGHLRIGLINGNTWHTFAAHRELGWTSALAARGLDAPSALTRQGPMSEEVGYRCALELLALETPPTALICSSLLQAVGSSRAIVDSGLEVGRDVSIVAHDDGMPSIRPDMITPALTTTFSSLRKAGSRIADVAQALGRGEPVDAFQEIWPVEIVFRGSAQRIRKK
jgi:LacI family transcriptional regulator